jgi:hypothetical protein
VAQADGDAVAEHNIERDGAHAEAFGECDGGRRSFANTELRQALAFVASNDDNRDGDRLDKWGGLAQGCVHRRILNCAGLFSFIQSSAGSFFGGEHMKPAIYLRTASVLTLLHAILHTVGGVFGKPQPGPQHAAVTAMKANRFPLMGAIRSFWEFYRGMGLGVTIFLVALAVVLWQLSLLTRKDSCRLTPIYWTLMAAFLFMAANSYVYFFWPPVIVELLIAVCLLGAIFTSKAPAR